MNLESSDVARLLTEIGKRLELAGESGFKSKAYYRAADSLLSLAEPLADVISRGALRSIPGVGEAIAEKIETFHRTGTHGTLERLRAEAPAGLLEILEIPGLRPEKVLIIARELGITSLDELEEACRAGELEGIKGLGPRLQAKILEGIRFARNRRGLSLLSDATESAEAACALLEKSCPEVESVVPTGAARRGCELIDDLSVIARIRFGQPPPAMPPVLPTVHLADSQDYGIRLLFTTGSPGHLESLTRFAERNGFTLSEDGLRRGREVIPCREEADIYAALGLSFIEPELREGGAEIEWAGTGRLPNLVQESDIRGILHSHTVASDGAESLEVMAEAVRERGYEYYGVADHSKSAFYAGGLKEEQVLAQHRLADRLNRNYESEGIPFRVFKGIESDILVDGSLDYPDSVLDEFDFVVASVHGRFGLEAGAQTARILRAVENPHTTILGHLTGRLLLRREPYDVDIEAILTACADHGVAVEINGNPNRLDIDWRRHQCALELGCFLSIDTDAHSIGELGYIRWGVLMARKGGVPRERILSCMDRRTIDSHFVSRKSRV